MAKKENMAAQDAIQANPNAAPTADVIHYVYDKVSGRVLHRHAAYNAEAGQYEEVPAEEVRALALEGGEALLNRVTDRNPENLDVLTVRDAPLTRTGRLLVDLREKKLVAASIIVLTPDRYEVAGDGKDTVKIGIEVVDEAGQRVKDFDGPVKVTTFRGKLSTRGGVVDLKKGVGAIELTSVAETVSRVKISAVCLRGTCEPGQADVEFV